MFGLGVLVGIFGTGVVQLIIAMITTIHSEKKGDSNK